MVSATARANVILLADGECAELAYSVPDLAGGAFPAGTRWKSGSGQPRAMEQDFGPDDRMGAASNDGNYFTVKVSNHGGDLSGPNGDEQTGGPEGSSIQVYISAIYQWPECVEQSAEFRLRFGHVGTERKRVVWKSRRYETGSICVTAE
jgi:hypothetical protein